MRSSTFLAAAVMATTLACASAHESGLAKPDLVLRETTDAMPDERRKEVRVMTAVFQPGDRTVTHTHRFPVTVYVLEGAFTLEIAGREPITVKAGQAMVEPAGVTMTGFNRSAQDPTKVVIFYVSSPATPFLDPTP
ncbi:cupin domain-containing protein [Alsobacter sp. KACC 23698]|uniref:Cupin domain-containing protein n=1 Tax=Alsobacter sp. KACC 23698 TaxID=3149229 RepID=A0AAU7JE51_9HYPH